MRVSGTDMDGTRFDLSVTAGRWEAGDGGEPFDLTGLHVLPGLVDAHAHLSAETLDVETVPEWEHILERARVARDRGVFDIVDKGWSDDLVLDLVADGRLRNPRVQAAGVMLHPHDGYWDSFGRVVDGSELVGLCAQLGGDRPWVKIVGDWPRKGSGALPNYDEGVLADAVEAAHTAGARTAVHTMAPDVASMAVRAGVDSIEHGLFLTEHDLELLAGRDGMWVPTVLRMHEVLAEMRPGSSGAELIGRGIENVRRLLPRAARLGVTVLAGSDLAIGIGEIGREVDALVQMGAPPEHAVAGVSHAAHAALGIEAGLWAGAPADLIAFAGDPVDDPGVLVEPVVVISAGNVITDRR